MGSRKYLRWFDTSGNSTISCVMYEFNIVIRVWYIQHLWMNLFGGEIIDCLCYLFKTKKKMEVLDTHESVVHYSDVIMSAMASQITSLIIVYSTAYSDTDQRKHQSIASLAFVQGIHRWPVNSPHKGPVTRKMFPFDDVIMEIVTLVLLLSIFRLCNVEPMVIWIWSCDVPELWPSDCINKFDS